MFKIGYDKKITMVQGDTGVIRMRISNYELSQGDEVRFAIVNKANPSILLCQHSDKKIVLEKQTTVFEKDGSARIVIYPYDTEYLQPGKYLYEIQVKTKDGRIDTVVPLTSFTLMDGSIQGEYGQTTPSKPEPTPSEIELRFKRLENEIIPELGNRITNVENEIDSVSSSLDNKVNKVDQANEMVSRRVRGQNNVDSPAGTFDFANFAKQGQETGIASTPIGGVIHHYTDGKVVQIDNVGENNVILTMVNANNPTRRPDKDSTFYGKGYFLQLFTNNQNKRDDVNTGGIYDHLTIDEKGMFFWSGYKPSGVKNNPTTFTTGKDYDYYPAFVFNAVKEHEDIIHLQTKGNTILSLRYNKTISGSEIYSPSNMDGMNIKTGKGDIRLQPVSGKSVRISNNAYINKQDGRGAKEVSVIDFGTTSERPTTNLQCGMMFFDRTLNKPIWRNKDNNGWVDAMGTSV